MSLLALSALKLHVNTPMNPPVVSTHAPVPAGGDVRPGRLCTPARSTAWPQPGSADFGAFFVFLRSN